MASTSPLICRVCSSLIEVTRTYGITVCSECVHHYGAKLMQEKLKNKNLRAARSNKTFVTYCRRLPADYNDVSTSTSIVSFLRHLHKAEKSKAASRITEANERDCWRPRTHHKFPLAIRSVMRTLLVLAKSSNEHTTYLRSLCSLERKRDRLFQELMESELTSTTGYLTIRQQIERKKRIKNEVAALETLLS